MLNHWNQQPKQPMCWVQHVCAQAIEAAGDSMRKAPFSWSVEVVPKVLEEAGLRGKCPEGLLLGCHFRHLWVVSSLLLVLMSLKPEHGLKIFDFCASYLGCSFVQSLFGPKTSWSWLIFLSRWELQVKCSTNPRSGKQLVLDDPFPDKQDQAGCRACSGLVPRSRIQQLFGAFCHLSTASTMWEFYGGHLQKQLQYPNGFSKAGCLMLLCCRRLGTSCWEWWRTVGWKINIMVKPSSILRLRCVTTLSSSGT